MASVTGLATHILGLLQSPAAEVNPSPSNSGAAGAGASGTPVPRVDAARLAFYHFLKNMCEPGEPLSTATLDRFFRRAMTHSHWAENKEDLFNEVANSLQHFSNQNGEPVPLPPFQTAAELQVVRAESFRSVERIVEEWIQAHQGPSDQIKVQRDRDERLIVCRLTLDRALSVHIFDRMLCLRDGRLEPLTDDMAIYYTPELTLDPHRISQIETAPHTIARFRNESSVGTSGGTSVGASGGGIRGLMARGFTFQKMAAFDGGELHRHPLLFYPLKRIEQFFVNRATDPMYIELTGLLEKASDLLSQKHPESVRFAEAAMERGRLAFEQVFVDDRLLRLLLENLERAIQLERRPLGAAAASSHFVQAKASSLTVDLPHQLGDNHENHLGIRLHPGEEFIEDNGPDLVELQETQFQEAESCETIAPVNLRAP